MADLLAKFKLVDDMSSRLADIADGGQRMVEQFERAGEASETAFAGITSSVTASASTIDGVAMSIESARNQLEAMGDGWEKELDAANKAKAGIEETLSSTDDLSEAVSRYGDTTEAAVSSSSHWTAAVGNYSKSALEAVYSTEELVSMGLKSVEALEEQERMLELCEQSSNSLSKSIEATADIENELQIAITQAAEAVEKQNYSESVSVETKGELSRATKDALSAMSELTRAQEKADAALQAYNEVMENGTANLEILENAAEKACRASEALAEANAKASSATEELSKATEKASEEAVDGGKKGVDALDGIAGALAAAGITAKVTEIAGAVYDLATAFSEAESTVVLATGATGEALDRLTASMMNAYAASKTGSLDETAAAVGEINTRLGYTDEQLSKTTEQFLDFAAVTGGNAASSVRSVTQLMNQWNVPATEMEVMLSKLTYAGQASGISVDALSQQLTTNKAVLDQLGFSLDEATAMFMNFELAGTNSTTVMTGFRKALSSGDISSLEELYNVFDQIASGAMTAAEASEVFGTKAGPAIVDAVQSGVLSLDDFVGALENSSGTLATTATAAQTLEQKWTQASNNISTAFTSAVQPTLDSASSGLAGLMNGFGDFLNEHPIITKGIVAIGVGLGSVAIGFAAVSAAVGIYNAVTVISTAVTAAFGVTLSAAIWPITLIVAGIAAVVAVVAKLVSVFSAAEDETAGMTAATRAQYYELQDLNAEYEEACEKYGETSEEALRLKYQVDDLSSAFEANRQTVEEFTAEVDALCESASQVTSNFNDSMTAIKNTEVGSLALIQKYEDLSTQATLTGAQEKELEAVTKKLAETYPDLVAQVDGATLSTEDYVEAMKKACEQEAEQQRQAQAQDTYVEALQKRAELTEEIAKAQENLNLEQARMDDMSGWTHFWTAGEWDDLEAYQAALDELNAAQAENEATIARIEQGWADISDAEQAAAEETISWEDAAAAAYENVKDRVIELCEAYGEAYNAALESFEGQFGLFDEASMKSEEYVNSTVENAQKALDSQLAYWDAYLSNVEVLKNTSAEDLGITQENYEALMAYTQDGSEQAAGLAASMVQAIQNGDEEAVAALANTVGEVSAKQEEIAAATADWVTDFTAQMDEIEQEMQATVEGMNLDTEAAASATATINAYADSIRAGKANAVAAAEEVANAVSAAFASAKTSVNVSVNSSGSVPGHANGTTNAESLFLAGEKGPELVARPAAAYANGTTNSTDYFIAGENGPELIAGQQGSTVFPTEETDRLISALNEKRQPLQIFPDGGEKSTQGGAGEQVKRILLEIAGSGAIEIGGGGADKETILEVLYEHLKPVLMNIIQGEIYEEGDYSYEY